VASRAEDKAPLSVAIITRDEAKRLPDCLKSVSFADEIVVVDSGSTDRTVEIAQEYGCRIFTEEWKGFGPQKTSAIEKCTHDWVLLLDADERLAPGSSFIVQAALAEGKAASAYSFMRKSHIGTHWIRYSDWWPDRVTRLIDRRKCRIRNITHEKVEAAGETFQLDAVIEHYPFGNYTQMIQKMDIYSTCLAREMHVGGKITSPFAPVSHGLWMFLRTFVIKRGFLDGFDGLVIALLNAAGSFFKYAKLYELQALGRNRADKNSRP
jgi:glycosyltransferase involved in cell wall biosynthesis